ncbi:hypothetical protein B0H19DRAFT_1080898 [Mycena capillaripes]|nr:hypothetical protein B0H19DRAFT_1080898 [Mycena capillaripes]
MYSFSKLITLGLCAVATFDARGCKNALTAQDGTLPTATLATDSFVKMVNIGCQGAVFAFPAGDVLVEKGNIAQDTFGVLVRSSAGPHHLFKWQNTELEESIYAFKSRATGFYIVAASDNHLITPPAEPPTVFQVTAAENNTYIINEPDAGLVWDTSFSGDSNVGRRKRFPTVAVGGSEFISEVGCGRVGRAGAPETYA